MSSYIVMGTVITQGVSGRPPCRMADWLIPCRDEPQ